MTLILMLTKNTDYNFLLSVTREPRKIYDGFYGYDNLLIPWEV